MDREERRLKIQAVGVEVAMLVHARCVEIGLDTNAGIMALIDAVIAIAMSHRLGTEEEMVEALVKQVRVTAALPRSPVVFG